MNLQKIIDTIGVEPYYQEKNGVLYNADCMNILPKISKKCIDLVLTDPPYGMNYRSTKRKNQFNFIEGDDNINFIKIVFPFFYKILNECGAMYIFCNEKLLSTISELFTVFKLNKKKLIIWKKNNHTAGDLRGDYSNIVEFIQWASKGRHILRGKRINNCWEIKKIFNLCHPTQKPIEIINIIIKKSSDIGNIILDPFIGSGTTAIAAKNLNRKYIGIEMSKEYCKIAKDRIIANTIPNINTSWYNDKAQNLILDKVKSLMKENNV